MASAYTRFLAAVDEPARRIGLYTAYALTPAEHLGTVYLPLGLHDARHYLKQNAYRPNYLSAAKRHPVSGEPHDLSYRHVPTGHPDAANGTAIADRYAPRECQYHVHVWDTDDGIEFYSHYEVRPDLFGPTFDPRRMHEHYRPTHGETYLRGVTDLDL